MLVNHLWRRLVQPVQSGELEELRRGTIFEICAVIFAVAWVLMIDGYGTAEKYVVPFVLFGGAALGIWMRHLELRVVLAWLVASLLVAITFQKLIFPQSPAQYYYPLVVIVSSLLVSGLDVFIVAGAASASLIAVASLQGAEWLDPYQVATPIMLTLMTAAAAFIGSRQMHLALQWMRTSYARTTELLEQLRDERASLAHTLKMLEDAYVRIEKMNYALVEARGIAENARQLKAEFAANISHELRTPLNLIIGFSETMANAPETYAGAVWSPALRGDVEQIYQSSRHLASLIDDILDLSALDAWRLGLTLQDAALDEVIAQAVAVVQDIFRAKRLYLRVKVEPDLPRVRVDVTRIRQVLINLLTNASRFTNSGGVTIRVHHERDEIQVAIQDTGIGIAPQDIPKVFEEFGQVDGSTTRRHEGTGLGVPLSKRLVEAHGGRMWLSSEPGVGSTFFFTLPALVDANRGPSVIWTDSRAASHYRKPLLVLGPDPLLLRTIRRQLSGYDVVEAKAGDSVPALVEQHQPIGLVVHTDDQDAIAPGRWPVPDDLPVIAVSMRGTLRAAQALGVRDYIVKPVLREQLLEAIADLGQPAREVLIVDDDVELADLIARMLESAGGKYHPIKSFGGAEALARMRSEPIDLVLLDMFMPAMDGMAVLREMKRDPALAEIPVIVISAQQPELAGIDGGLFVQLTRATRASTTETLNYLQALVGALPLRGLPATPGASTSRPVPGGPPAF